MPNTNELLDRLAAGSVDDLQSMLASPADREDLVAFFGEEEVEQLAAEASRSTRAAGRGANIVVLPGIMGSVLQSTRGLLGLLWISPLTILNGHLNRLEMTPDGQRDADPQVHVVATGPELVIYTRLLFAASRAGQVFPFPYDWRRDVRQPAAGLKDKLDQWAAGSPGTRFTLVGHSMGGLVALAYLAAFPAHAEAHVERVIMVGTPLRGSVEAIFSLAVDNSLMALMTRLNPGNATLRLVRTLPGLYQLLPPSRRLFPPDLPYPVNFDLFDAHAWPVEGLVQRHLQTAQALHELLAASDPQVPLVQIAGCNLPTRINARKEGRQLRWATASSGEAGGDGTVPLWSATLRGGDTYFVPAEHTMLPREAAVIEAVLALAHGDQPDLDKQISQSRTTATAAPPAAIDVDAEARRLRRAIEQGTLTAADLDSLRFLARDGR